MMSALYVIYRVLAILLYAFDFLLFVRAICSWVMSFRNSFVYNLSYTITEPILSPVRKLLWKMDFVRRCPIDLSFLVVVILTSLAERGLNILFLRLIGGIVVM